MKRIITAAAAALASAPLLIAQPGDAYAKKAQPANPTRSELSTGCKLYTNVLTLVGKEHLTGTITVAQSKIAEGAFQSILAAGHSAAIKGDDTKDGTVSVLKTVDEGQIESWTLKGETIDFTPASGTFKTFADHCSYLNTVAIKVNQLTGTPIHSLFETATEAAVGIAKPEDQHSGYLALRSFQEVARTTKGEFGGIGIELIKKSGEPVFVQKIIPGGPSEKAGMKDGDRITHIDGLSTLPMDSNVFVENALGLKGTTVKLTIKRGDTAPFDVTVARDIIIPAVVESFLLNGTPTGVIKVKTFSEQTTKQLLAAAVKLAEQSHAAGENLTQLIIRFENNAGGLLDQALMVSDLLVDSSPDMIRRLVSTGKSPTDLQNTTIADSVFRFNIFDYINQRVPEAARVQQLSISVLQNGGSASASEIVAGAFQDVGPVIGTRSFGKGTVQTIIPLTAEGLPTQNRQKAHGALRVTTAAFFPGSGQKMTEAMTFPDGTVVPPIASVGKSNLASGIIPDIQVVTGDFRDDAEGKRYKEPAGLIDPKLTREGQKPAGTCTLRETYRGAISDAVAKDVPPQLLIEIGRMDPVTTEISKVRVVDANLACAIEFRGKTTPSLVELVYVDAATASTETAVLPTPP